MKLSDYEERARQRIAEVRDARSKKAARELARAMALVNRGEKYTAEEIIARIRAGIGM